MASPNNNVPKARSSKAENASSSGQYAHELEEVFPGGRVSVFTDEGKKYFVGVQLAALLKRETFNLYRSMKIKNVGVSRASHNQVSFLVKAGAVRPGTHSVTLVDYEACHAFLRDLTKKRRSEPDIMVPGKGIMEFENAGMKQRRSSSALPLTESQLHRLYVPDVAADFNAQNRGPAVRQLPAAVWEAPEAALHGPMIFVRDQEMPVAPPLAPQQVTPAYEPALSAGEPGGRWYYRAQQAASPQPVYWVSPPAAFASGAQPQAWGAAAGAASMADQQTDARTWYEPVSQQQQPQETDVDELQELASDL